MAVTTNLTWMEKKNLQQLLGHTSLSLLYKSSVHGQNLTDMLQKCSLQGSTITLVYGYNHPTIHGVFILGHYPKRTKKSKNSISSFYFSLPRTTNRKTFEVPTSVLLNIYKMDEDYMEISLDNKQAFSLTLKSRRFQVNFKLSDGQHIQLFNNYAHEWEVFRVEGIKDDTNYIKKITGFKEHRQHLLDELRAYKPSVCLTPEVRILLLGPVGSGKSTFINSVKSVFLGRVSHQALTGSDITSITEQFRIYSIEDGKDGVMLPFMLCDTMGLDEKEDVGLCMEDIPHILKGSIPDRYQFNPQKSMIPTHSSFIISPSLKERIHCVAYVFDINSVNNLSSKLVEKFQRIQKEVLNRGIAHVVLFTNVNNWDKMFRDGFQSMSRSTAYERQIKQVVKMLNISISNILMVENYASEWQLEPFKDSLILSVVRQMLRITDDFLEDLLLE